MDIKKHILSLFENKKCYSCQQDGHFFCPKCANDLEKYSPYCYVCKKYSKGFMIHETCSQYIPNISSIVVLTHYKYPIIKRLLKLGKYYNKPGIYGDIIDGNRDFFIQESQIQNSVLIPVPMHFLRRWKRGYNQSYIISKELSKNLDVSVNTKLLKKNKYSKQQSKLKASQRSKNLNGSYKCNPQKNIDFKSHIYLVDDIVSSASTLEECALILKKSGYKNISAICLASD